MEAFACAPPRCHAEFNEDAHTNTTVAWDVWGEHLQGLQVSPRAGALSFLQLAPGRDAVVAQFFFPFSNVIPLLQYIVERLWMYRATPYKGSALGSQVYLIRNMTSKQRRLFAQPDQHFYAPEVLNQPYLQQ